MRRLWWLVVALSALLVIFAPSAANAATEAAHHEWQHGLYWLGVLFAAGLLAWLATCATRPPRT